MTTDTLAAEGRRLLEAGRDRNQAKLTFEWWASENREAILSALEERDQLRSLLKEAGPVLNDCAANIAECAFHHYHEQEPIEPQLAQIARVLSTRIREALGSVAALPGINHAPANRPTQDDPAGCAEREVGRWVYNRVSSLMDAKAGTPEDRELGYLSRMVSDVEEYGATGAEGDPSEFAEPPRPTREEVARPESEWHEDDGNVLWWTMPVSEPPWCGMPLHEDWPGYHTHWTRFSIPTHPTGDA